MLDRSSHAILVPAAHSTAGIGVIRSLGAAGYRVHAVAATAEALGLRSRFAERSVVHPPFGSAECDRWFHEYVRQNAIEMITPGAFSYSPTGATGHYPHLFTTPTDFEVLGWTGSKFALFERLAVGAPMHRAHLPPFLLVDLDCQLPSEVQIAGLGEPLFVKLDSSEARREAPSEVLRVNNARDCRDLLERLSRDYRRTLVQGFVPGRGAGVFLLRWNGRILARMMHLRLHEMPHTGGASSLRVSWWHEKMMADAECKLDTSGGAASPWSSTGGTDPAMHST